MSKCNVIILIIVSTLVSQIECYEEESLEWDFVEIEDEDEKHRVKRAGPFQNIFGQIETLQECCVVPNIVPNLALNRCAPLNGKVANAYQAVSRKGTNQQIVMYNGGLFGAIGNLFRGMRRRKRQDEPPTDAPATEAPPGDTTVDATTAAPAGDTTTAAPAGDTTTGTPEGSDTTTTTASGGSSSSGGGGSTAAGGTTAAPQLQKFGIQSVCYTDCIFRDLKLINDNNSVLIDDSKKLFATTLKTTAIKGTDTKWTDIVNTAVASCATPTNKGTPAKILINTGRVCSTRPIIFMTCMRRYMVDKCPDINKNQKCNIKRTVLRNTNIYNLG